MLMVGDYVLMYYDAHVIVVVEMHEKERSGIKDPPVEVECLSVIFLEGLQTSSLSCLSVLEWA